MDTTSRTHKAFLALASAAVIAQALITFARSPEATARPVHQASPAQTKLVAWALDRFEQAGLDLPAFDVYFHSDVRECQDRLGLYWSDQRRLDMCTYHFDLVAKLTILHEMAHAWDDLALTDDTRRRFMDLRGVETWASWSHPWERRGAEHAAEVITWGLMDERVHSVHIPNNDPEQLGEAFEMLTARAPISPSTPTADDWAGEILSPEVKGASGHPSSPQRPSPPSPSSPYL